MAALLAVALLGMWDLGLGVLKVLAVVGGAAVGAAGTGFLIRVLGRALAFRQAPRRLVNFSRLLGGLAVGLAVWLWVSGSGGGGLGGGGGWWPFGERGGGGSGKDADASSKRSPPTEGRPAPASVRVRMRGGEEAEKDQRFYLIEGDTGSEPPSGPPRDWSELKSYLTEQRDKLGLKSIDIVIGKSSVAENSPAVRQLEAWAQEHHLSVNIKKEIDN